MKQRKIKKLPVIILVFVLLIIILVMGISIYKYNISAVSNDAKEIDFKVETGSNFYSISYKLKENGLIRSEFFYKLYVKLNKSNLKAGTYKLKKNMSVKQIIDLMSENSKYNPNSITITFKEGKNMRYIVNTIVSNTNNNSEQVYSLLSNQTYLNELINNYWFINEEVLNSNIYYSLEGYLYPNTYGFNSKDVTVKEIFKTMLDETNKKLSVYKDQLSNNSYSIHEILTLASIVELEGANAEDRKNIAGVFFNRLKSNMSLGSDVTTYYAAKVDMSERDLYSNELNDENNYNTRSSIMAGKLPIGPICNPSVSSIEAVLNPTVNDDYYFISDKNKKIYFSKTSSEQTNKKNQLIEAGLWYTYE